jgi:hypothetical protein
MRATRVLRETSIWARPILVPRIGDALQPGHGKITGGHYYFYILDVSKTTANVKVSHFADNFLGGSHDFKFGIQFGHAASGGVYGLNDFVFYAGTGADRYGYGYEYQPFSYGGNTRSFGVFVDDTFTVNDRLTLNMGVRFDNSNAYSPEQPELNEDLSETGATFPSQDHFTWNTVSPRLGFNVKLTGDGRTVFKGHWGRYHRTVTTGDFSNVVGPSIPPILYGTDFNFGTDEFGSLELLRDPSENLSIDSNIKSPYTDQFILSVDQEAHDGPGLSHLSTRGADCRLAGRDGSLPAGSYVERGRRRLGRDDHRLQARERRRGSRVRDDEQRSDVYRRQRLHRTGQQEDVLELAAHLRPDVHEIRGARLAFE